MTTTTIDHQAASGIAARILREGYGEGAWHGPDLKAALADVTPELAFRRPAPGRHNIAEIALHHAYTVHNVRGKLSRTEVEPFPLAGEDWFELSDPSTLAWPKILDIAAREQNALEQTVRDRQIEADQFDLVLGITCHAVYHAGQIQLIKRLTA
jgi:hypothetical protein